MGTRINNCLPDTSHTKYSLAGAVVNYILWMKRWINGLQGVDKIASAIILRRFSKGHKNGRGLGGFAATLARAVFVEFTDHF